MNIGESIIFYVGTKKVRGTIVEIVNEKYIVELEDSSTVVVNDSQIIR
ncbi:hypothetical protein V1503_18775 [Bacillus sp. SCS-151]